MKIINFYFDYNKKIGVTTDKEFKDLTKMFESKWFSNYSEEKNKFTIINLDKVVFIEFENLNK